MLQENIRRELLAYVNLKGELEVLWFKGYKREAHEVKG